MPKTLSIILMLIIFCLASLHAQMIVLDSSNRAALTVAPDGKVGIGTSTPEATLQVNGQMRIGSFKDPGNPSARHVMADNDGLLKTQAAIPAIPAFQAGHWNNIGGGQNESVLLTMENGRISYLGEIHAIPIIDDEAQGREEESAKIIFSYNAIDKTLHLECLFLVNANQQTHALSLSKSVPAHSSFLFDEAEKMAEFSPSGASVPEKLWIMARRNSDAQGESLYLKVYFSQAGNTIASNGAWHARIY